MPTKKKEKKSETKGKKQTRKVLTIELKIAIIKMHDKGATNSKIAREKKLGESTIRGIIKKKEDILKQAEIMTESGVELTISSRQSRSRAMLKMETLIVIWLQDLETRNFPVGLAQIQEKARILFQSINEGLQNKSDYEKKLEAKGFDASNGWFQNFQKRRGYQSINLKGEAASADKLAAKAYPETFQKILSDGQYNDHQVWNVDEAGHNWKMPPSRSYVQNINKTSASGSKLLKDRFTVLMGGNMAGEKMKPYLLYKYENPRCFKGVCKATLPVNFRSNRKAWMTSTSFKDWLVNFFIPYVQKYCRDQNIAYKILLVLDNCPAHPDLSDIDPNIKFCFLPPNTTSLLQPMDMGVISVFKTNYKHLLLDAAISSSAGNTATFLEFLKAFTIKNAIDLLGIAWDNVPTSCMINVWKRLMKDQDDLESKNLENKKIDEIIELGKNFGLEDMDVENVRISVNYQEDDLSVEELMELGELPENAVTNNNTDNDVEIIENRILTAETVKKALLNLSEVCDLLAENDPDQERLIKFQQLISEGGKLYKNWLTKEKSESVQKDITDFFENSN